MSGIAKGRPILAALAVIGVMLPAGSARAETVRERAIAKLEAQFTAMRKGVWKARISGCNGWECTDGTAYFKLPGRIDIQYDQPTGGRVIADGQMLRQYNNSDDEQMATPQDQTPLGVLLRGSVEDEVEVVAVEEYDRGELAGSPRHVYQIELECSADNQRITVYATRDDFTLLGWRVVLPRGEFVATLRDLRRVEPGRVKKLPRGLFEGPTAASRRRRR